MSGLHTGCSSFLSAVSIALRYFICMHAYINHVNGHFLGEPELAACPIDVLSLFVLHIWIYLRRHNFAVKLFDSIFPIF